MQRVWVFVIGLALAACGVEPAPQPRPVPAAAPAPQAPVTSPEVAARNFVQVVERVKPVAETFCRERRPDLNCTFKIVIDDRRGAPPNAFQTLDPATGQPIIGFTLALIADARNRDELAFILGHEAGHHVSGHIMRARTGAVTGAIILGTLAALGGADAAVVRTAQDVGATVGARSYSRSFELEADALGTVIAFRAGFDPERGAGFFDRLPDPGNRFLGTHPPNSQRIEVVRATLADLRSGRIR